MNSGIVGKFLTPFIAYFPHVQHGEDKSRLYNKILTKISGMLQALYKCLLGGYYPLFTGAETEAQDHTTSTLQGWMQTPVCRFQGHWVSKRGGGGWRERGFEAAALKSPWPPRAHPITIHLLSGLAHRRPLA